MESIWNLVLDSLDKYELLEVSLSTFTNVDEITLNANEPVEQGGSIIELYEDSIQAMQISSACNRCSVRII